MFVPGHSPQFHPRAASPIVRPALMGAATATPRGMPRPPQPVPRPAFQGLPQFLGAGLQPPAAPPGGFYSRGQGFTRGAARSRRPYGSRHSPPARGAQMGAGTARVLAESRVQVQQRQQPDWRRSVMCRYAESGICMFKDNCLFKHPPEPGQAQGGRTMTSQRLPRPDFPEMAEDVCMDWGSNDEPTASHGSDGRQIYRKE